MAEEMHSTCCDVLVDYLTQPARCRPKCPKCGRACELYNPRYRDNPEDSRFDTSCSGTASEQ